MGKAFADCWIKIRARHGFKTAYDFYNKSGGRKVLGFSFVNYWRIEKGRFLPRADRLPLMISCLRLRASLSETRQLAQAYLKDLLASERAYQWLYSVLQAKQSGDGDALKRAARSMILTQTHQISLEAARAIHENYASYWAFVVLMDDGEAWSLKDLAKKIGVSAAETSKALKALARHKLVQELPDGRVKCPVADKHLNFPDFDQLGPRVRENVKNFHKRMIDGKGMPLRRVYCLARVHENEFQHYFNTLQNAVGDVSIYASSEKGPGHSLVLVEGLIHRVFPL